MVRSTQTFVYDSTLTLPMEALAVAHLKSLHIPGVFEGSGSCLRCAFWLAGCRQTFSRKTANTRAIMDVSCWALSRCLHDSIQCFHREYNPSQAKLYKNLRSVVSCIVLYAWFSVSIGFTTHHRPCCT